jgi:hypothetical protein
MGDDGAAGKAFSLVLVSRQSARLVETELSLSRSGSDSRWKSLVRPSAFPTALPDCAYNRRVPIAPQDVEMEDLNFYYANYSRIYNDVITLRKGSSYM